MTDELKLIGADMKPCVGCHIEKPLTAYYAHPATKDGHVSKCKECVKVEAASHRKAHPEYYRNYQRKHKQVISPETKRQYDATYKAKHPDKLRARMTAYYARRKGTLVRQPCEVCEAKAEAHHEDYTRPLDVRWLCRVHHGVAHRKDDLTDRR